MHTTTIIPSTQPPTSPQLMHTHSQTMIAWGSFSNYQLRLGPFVSMRWFLFLVPSLQPILLTCTVPGWGLNHRVNRVPGFLSSRPNWLPPPPYIFEKRYVKNCIYFNTFPMCKKGRETPPPRPPPPPPPLGMVVSRIFEAGRLFGVLSAV
jgi:hypothetical protein